MTFRVYEPSECGPDGYPFAWHRLDHDTLLDWSSSIGESHYPPGAVMGVKHIVRAEAGHRCVRCLHPFVCGKTPGEWSPCDERCEHGGEVRWLNRRGEWTTVPLNLNENAVREARCRVLTVHHLRLGQDAKRDLRWWNLAALCQRCHLQIQGKVVMERVWPWPHSEWFRIYAAGWYAWAYLGEDITREEAVARMDELLALELAA